MSIYSIEYKKKYPEIDLSAYFQFIEERRLPNKIKFESHTHHILPKWAFPEFRRLSRHKWNSVNLKLIDHYTAHKILYNLWPVIENISSVFLLRKLSGNAEEVFLLEKARIDLLIADCKNRVDHGIHNFQSDKHRLSMSKLAKTRIANGTHSLLPENLLKTFGYTNSMKDPITKEKVITNKTKTLL